MERFILEILAFILIIYLLKRIWNEKVKVIMGQAVIGINIFACFIYIYGLMYQSMPLALVVPKVFLHGLVALIIHTLFTIDTKKDEWTLSNTQSSIWLDDIHRRILLSR